jgi:hypothetical protein
MKKLLENEGWIYDECETSCKSYVKGIYDMWIYPQDKNRIVIESEEYGVQVNEFIKDSEHLLKIIQPFKRS